MSHSLNIKYIVIILTIFCLTDTTGQAFGPTVPQSGKWEAISSSQIVQAKINDQIERVCLPRIKFKDEIDQNYLKKQLKEGIPTQEAIFHLYHDGLGRPQKKGGMYYASDVYLKDMKLTYTGYLQKLGYKFSVGEVPAFEDKEFLRDILYSDHIATAEEKEKEKKKKEKDAAGNNEEKQGKTKAFSMRVTTIFDVLPAGVIPPRIRAQQEEIARRVNSLKNRPYETEIIQIDPLRWATGKMGLIKEDGSIIAANIEGQQHELQVRPPETKNWLTPEMIAELNGQPCEFVIQRYATGLEVLANNRYQLRDIYFSKLKQSWEEWLQKHGLSCPEFKAEPSYASGTIALEVKLVTGKWSGIKAPVLCQIDFEKNNDLVQQSELLRIFPPRPRPKKFAGFARHFNQLFNGKEADISILVCPDGKPYHELGQKRARRIYFPEQKATLEMLQNQLLTGKIR
ncbi:MAG: hypothetical protein PHV05_06530 [Candidatus Riflebacteria bacterium]|nr:hypothetical protein [Candidatus Riflebacteria bacterium]